MQDLINLMRAQNMSDEDIARFFETEEAGFNFGVDHPFSYGDSMDHKIGSEKPATLKGLSEAGSNLSFSETDGGTGQASALAKEDIKPRVSGYVKGAEQGSLPSKELSRGTSRS